MRVEDLTSLEFAEALVKDPVVIVPVGLLEEHGAHLPLSTDMIQPLETVARAAERTGALVMPPMWYGQCSSTKNFPGSISLSFDTLRYWAKDVALELARNGVRRIMFLSGHAGSMHMSALKLGTKEALESIPGDLVLCVLSDYDFAFDVEGVENDDGHAGMLETSRVLAIRPDLVKKERPVEHPVFPRFRITKNAEKYWPKGVHGDTTNASGEFGKKVNDHIVEELVKLIGEMKDERLC